MKPDESRSAPTSLSFQGAERRETLVPWLEVCFRKHQLLTSTATLEGSTSYSDHLTLSTCKNLDCGPANSVFDRTKKKRYN